MANKAYLFCAVAGVLFMNGQIAQAEEPNEDATYQTESPKREKPDAQQTLSGRLESAILRWNDAMVDGNEDQVAACQKTVLGLLGEDVKTLEKELKLLEQMSVSTKRNKNFAKAVDRSGEVRAREMLHEKKLLLSSIKNSDSFGNTYRLLGDYLYLTRLDEEVPALAGAVDSCSFTDSLK